MSDSDGSPICHHPNQALAQHEPDDPEPRRLRLATGQVNGPRPIRG